MCRSADWIILNLLLYLNLQTVVLTGVLYSPRFISSWTFMDTADNSTMEKIYEHGFNENPVKAEVQVQEVGKEVIFPGIKSANVIHINKTTRNARVGVLCLYNATHVRIMAPPNIGTMTNYLIYTGSESHYQTNRSTGWNGIVYATSKEDIQLWAPDANANGLVFTYFGWGTCTDIPDCMYTKVNVSISLWDTSIFGASYKCNSNAFGGHRTVKRFAHKASEKVNIDNDILDITATVQSPRISVGRDYIFPGTGNAMMDGTNSPVGLVYGFNDMTNEIHIWHAMCRPCFIIKVGSHSDGGAGVSINYCVWRGVKRIYTSGTTERTPSSITTPSTQNDSTSSTNPPRHQPFTMDATTGDHYSMTKMSESISGVNLSGDTVSTPAVIWKAPVLCLGRYPDSCINLVDLGQNVFIDFSRVGDDTVGYGYVMFMCKTGYTAQSGDANRTINLIAGTITLSGDRLICKERNRVHGKVDTEARVKELVKNLILPSNSTSKHRRSLESVRDLRIASRAIGVVSGVVIGGLIGLVVINDLVRFVRHVCSL